MKQIIAIIALGFVLSGCADKKMESESSTQTSGSTTSATTTTTPDNTTEQKPASTAFADYKPMKEPKSGDTVAIMETSLGKIVLGFLPDVAPNHVKNFTDLAGKKFYDNTKFHRVIPGFMIQGGDPNTRDKGEETWGMGGPDSRVKAEFNSTPHLPGILSMARSSDPNSAGSQFFIVHGDARQLDNQYTAFGYVIQGMDVVDKIANVETKASGSGEKSSPVTPPVLVSVKVAKWPIQ